MTLTDLQAAAESVQLAIAACENDIRAGRCRNANVRELVRAANVYSATRARVMGAR